MSQEREGSVATAQSPITNAQSTPQENLSKCFGDLRTYMEGEMSIQAEEWAFVERCNHVLRHRYGKLNQRADVVVASVQETQRMLDKLPEYYSKVDELDRNLEALEMVVNGLDVYSKVLETKYCGGPVTEVTTRNVAATD